MLFKVNLNKKKFKKNKINQFFKQFFFQTFNIYILYRKK